MLPGHYCPSLQAAIVRFGSWLPFARVPAELAGLTRTSIGVETVRRLTETVGAALEAAETQALRQLEHDLPTPPAGPAVQQLSADGAMVPLLHGAWAEVKTVAIGTVEAEPRSSRPAAATPKPVHARALSYFARLCTAAQFGHLATLETHRRGTATAGTVVAVTDGAPWLQDFIALQCPDAVRILDFPHAAEHLAPAAHAAFGDGSLAATAWLDQQCHELKHGDPDRVLAALTELPSATAAAAKTCAQVHTYLRTRRAQLAYATFQAAGYPIGDGMVESANKLVVEARLKGSGMHWSRTNVNPLLALRTALCNERWDEAWTQSATQRRTQAREQAHHRRVQRRRANRSTRPPRQRLDPLTALPAPMPILALPAACPVPRPKLVVNGKPTRDHPWRRFCLPGSRDFPHSAIK